VTARTRRAAIRVGVVDHGAGNLVSVDQALVAVGAEPVRVRRPPDLDRVDALVLPGVGAARPAMRRIAARGLVEPLLAWIAADRPFLGICLGLQLLLDSSDEDGARTLGVVPGRSARLDGAPTLPHIGWNQLEIGRRHPLLRGIPDGADVAFVHSFAPELAPEADPLVLARTTHGRRFVSAIARDKLAGVQFHPERSGAVGLRLLANFVGLG